MNREYHKWYSKSLGREMELLVFGYAGTPVIFFPTRTARFYDYENYKIIDALSGKIDSGQLQVYCVDSIDTNSFFRYDIHPSEKIKKHHLYELYILEDVIPLIRAKNKSDRLVAAGCSLGAFHAANIAFRHPHLFSKVVAMSGRYDLTMQMECFPDLFNGYWNEDIYFNMPSQYVPNLEDNNIIEQLKKMEILFVIGKDDPFYFNNRFIHCSLKRKGIWSELLEWEGEAHRPRYWRKMVQMYL